MVVLETGLQNPDEGPVLDPDWPSVLRSEVRDIPPISLSISFTTEVVQLFQVKGAKLGQHRNVLNSCVCGQV